MQKTKKFAVTFFFKVDHIKFVGTALQMNRIIDLINTIHNPIGYLRQEIIPDPPGIKKTERKKSCKGCYSPSQLVSHVIRTAAPLVSGCR